MKQTKAQKGITLVALIITIIILLILAVVAIRAVQGDGILKYAQNAKEGYELAEENERATLDSYLSKIEGSIGSGATGGTGNPGEDGGDNTDTGTKITIAEAKGKVLSTTSNTEVWDEYGNKIVVPAGFKITEDASHVTEGIVIEDVSAGTETVGSQFVWIPVGEVYTTTDENKTEENTKTIELNRYTFALNGTAKAKGDAIIENNFTERTSSKFGEAVAKDIEAFISSATTKGGYYLGRYEARTTSSVARTSENDELTTVTSIKTNSVYNYVTQSQASAQSQAMYTNANFTSDLINSYAWDTAIVFIHTFSGDSDYSWQVSLNASILTTGTENDKLCNIYDMASNCMEWTTETCRLSSYPCVRRGGYYNNRGGDGSDGYSTCIRNYAPATSNFDGNSFRPLIYVAL